MDVVGKSPITNVCGSLVDTQLLKANNSQKARVLAIIPCLNEEKYIERVVLNIIKETNCIDLRIVIVDGGSTDGTLGIISRLSAQFSELIIINNERKVQSAGINKAVDVCGDNREYIVRVDAHCDYPDDYCNRLVEAQRETGAASVVVRISSSGGSCFQHAVAAAQNTRLGNGGSAHRLIGRGRYIDHGHHALMMASAFRTVGGYDEFFSHNEDAELDLRLRGAGFNIWLIGEMVVTYFPRSTARSLFRQYLNYGRGRASTYLKHRIRPNIRQLLPLSVAPAIVLALCSQQASLLALPALLWAALCFSYGIFLGIRTCTPCAALSGFPAMIMHLAWSLGFIATALMALMRNAGARSDARSSDIVARKARDTP